MSTSTWLLAVAVFGACAVEAVEALTIVLAAGATRGWRSAIEGTVTALVVLAALVGAVGVPLVRYVPVDALRVVIGSLLLVLGLQWLRKAVLRTSGRKARHDEDAVYEQTVRQLAAGRSPGGAASPVPARSPRRDAMGFTVAFKGVFLEGMEVVLIVLTLGASARRLGVASVAAAAAVLLVTGVGLVVARQLSAVPENTIKTVVGVMLTSFGIFWTGEGAGVHWPGADLWVLALVAFFLSVTPVLVAALRRPAAAPAAPQVGVDPTAAADPLPSPPTDRPPRAKPGAWVRSFGRFWWDFLVGDTPEVTVGSLAVLGITFALRHDRVAAAACLPIAVAILLATSASLAARGAGSGPITDMAERRREQGPMRSQDGKGGATRRGEGPGNPF